MNLRVPTPSGCGSRGQEFSLSLSVLVGPVFIVYCKRLSGSIYTLRSTGQIARYCLSMCLPGSVWLLPGDDDTIFACMSSDDVLKRVDMQGVGIQLCVGSEVSASPTLRADMAAFTVGCGLIKYGWMHVGTGFDTLMSSDALLPLKDGEVYRDVHAFTLRSELSDSDKLRLQILPSIYRIYPLRDACVSDRASVVSLPRFFKVSIRCLDVTLPKMLRDEEGLIKYWSIVHGIQLTRENDLESVNVCFGKICLAYPKCCMWSDTWVRLPSTSVTNSVAIFTRVEEDFKALESSFNQKHDVKRKAAPEGDSRVKKVKRT